MGGDKHHACEIGGNRSELVLQVFTDDIAVIFHRHTLSNSIRLACQFTSKEFVLTNTSGSAAIVK